MGLKGPMAITYELDCRVADLPSARIGLSEHQAGAKNNEMIS